MASITEALEPIQISAMDQRQNTSDIFDTKSAQVKVSRIPDEAYAFALALNYIPIASLGGATLCLCIRLLCRVSKVFDAWGSFHLYEATASITFGNNHSCERKRPMIIYIYMYIYKYFIAKYIFILLYIIIVY